MSQHAAHGKTRRFDEEGFLRDPKLWSHALAERLAREHGLDGLGPEHWRVLDWLRRHYQEYGVPPSAHQVCHENELPHNCIDRLFHRDMLAAWRIAGLPDPGAEARTYMKGSE